MEVLTWGAAAPAAECSRGTPGIALPCPHPQSRPVRLTKRIRHKLRLRQPYTCCGNSEEKLGWQLLLLECLFLHTPAGSGTQQPLLPGRLHSSWLGEQLLPGSKRPVQPSVQSQCHRGREEKTTVTRNKGRARAGEKGMCTGH